VAEYLQATLSESPCRSSGGISVLISLVVALDFDYIASDAALCSFLTWL